MQRLELGEAASVDQIKQAYRRLAQRLHPDKHGGDDHARKRFVEVADAYRTLIRAARAVERGKQVGLCWQCRQFGEVITTMEGHARCPQCALRLRTRRFLPLPVMVVVKCVSTFVLLGLGIYLLVAALSTDSGLYAAAAFITGLLGLATLAHTCVTVVYCLRPRGH